MRVGLDTEATLLDDAREWQLLNEALDHVAFAAPGDEVDPVLPREPEGAARRDAAPHGHDRRAARAGAERARDDVNLQRLDALDAIEAYARLKRERNAIDYGDQIGLAVWLLQRQPEILERLRERFRYVFLDEYQDTDVAQRELVKLIAGEAELVCAVGDVDQGIFGWRGATIFNMAGFGDDFPGARTETLSVNFRSRPEHPRPRERADRAVRAGGWERKPLQALDHEPQAEIEGFVAAHELDEAAGIADRIAAARRAVEPVRRPRPQARRARPDLPRAGRARRPGGGGHPRRLLGPARDPRRVGVAAAAGRTRATTSRSRAFCWARHTA